ncbi:MAG: polysaccharide biosynthesis/export family protein, partial [Gammaproteobacteria bacterium]
MQIMRTLAVFTLAVLAAGCEAPAPSQGSAAAPAAAAPPAEPVQYRIGPGDQLQVNTWQYPEYSPTLMVLPDGEISFPLIGEVKAEGLTEKELATLIRDKLSEYVRSPEVTVTVVNPESANFQQRIRVTGA